MNEGKDTHTVAHSHKHPDEMEFEAAHAHTSRATPDITGAPEVKRPHIKWKRHRRANSCALTTERSQGLEPVVSCLAHSPRGERDILLIWATSDRSACLFWRQNKRQRGAAGGGEKKGRSRDSGRSRLTKERSGSALSRSPFLKARVRARPCASASSTNRRAKWLNPR